MVGALLFPFAVPGPQVGIQTVPIRPRRSVCVAGRRGQARRVRRRPVVLRERIIACVESARPLFLYSINRAAPPARGDSRAQTISPSSARLPLNNRCRSALSWLCPVARLCEPPAEPEDWTGDSAGSWSGPRATVSAQSSADSPPASALMGKLNPSPRIGCGQSHKSGFGPSTEQIFLYIPMFCARQHCASGYSGHRYARRDT